MSHSRVNPVVERYHCIRRVPRAITAPTASHRSMWIKTFQEIERQSVMASWKGLRWTGRRGRGIWSDIGVENVGKKCLISSHQMMTLSDLWEGWIDPNREYRELKNLIDSIYTMYILSTWSSSGEKKKMHRHKISMAYPSKTYKKLSDEENSSLYEHIQILRNIHTKK